MDELTNIINSPAFWALFIPAIMAVFTLYANKSFEREAEWRKEKLRLYLSFVEALSGITDGEINIENEIKFAKSCNDLHALASADVIKSLHIYQETMSKSNTSSTIEDKQRALTKLIYNMRRDLKIRPQDMEGEFEMRLWTAGYKQQ